MKPIDSILIVLVPTLILLHLLIAPYTKVEESFNIQAIHDISVLGLPLNTPPSSLRRHQAYDHIDFSGAVPRSFIGALILAFTSHPIFEIIGRQHAQTVVRAVLGGFNAFGLLRYRNGLVKAFGEGVGRWYVLLQVTQFHVVYYASRTLPNTFAFGITTLAFCQFLPIPGPRIQEQQRQRRGIYLLVFAGVVFRSEIAILLFTQVSVGLIQSKITWKQAFMAGLTSGILSVAATTAIDSYFWQKPLWPELWGFYFNAVEGKSSEWGTSPYSTYFVSLLPKLLLNPLIQGLLIPMAIVLPATKQYALDLVIPSLLFVAIYSLQPHKEARFIIYVVPPLTAAASLAASYTWTRRSKTLLYRLGSILLALSIAGTFAASTAMLLISSLNYPGGEALSTLHTIIQRSPHPSPSSPKIHIHMDVLSCMTGVTRFQELPHQPYTPYPFSLLKTNKSIIPKINGQNTLILYDKTENQSTLLDPAFWATFDYAIVEDLGKAIGNWEVLDTIYAYDGIEFLRPGDGSSISETLERVYAANNLTVSKDGEVSPSVPSSEDVRNALDGVGMVSEVDSEKGISKEELRTLEDLKMKMMLEEMSRFGTFNLLRDAVRLFTGGYWVGPRMVPRLSILGRVRGQKEDEVGDVVVDGLYNIFE